MIRFMCSSCLMIRISLTRSMWLICLNIIQTMRSRVLFQVMGSYVGWMCITSGVHSRRHNLGSRCPFSAYNIPFKACDKTNENQNYLCHSILWLSWKFHFFLNHVSILRYFSIFSVSRIFSFFLEFRFVCCLFSFSYLG